MIRRPDRVDFFCRYAEHLDWLNWAATQDSFQELFASDHPFDEVGQRLSRWFADIYAIADEARSDAAWAVLTRLGGPVSVCLWQSLAQALHSADSAPRPEHHQRWLRLLMWQERPGRQSEYLEYALVETDPSTEPDLALELFEHLMQPQPHPKSGYGLFGPTLEVQTRGSEHWLTESLDKVVRPLLPGHARDVLTMTEVSIRRHYTLETAINGKDTDSFSSHRSAIQPHAQDEYRVSLDPVIDAARDCLVVLAAEAPHEAASIARRWLSSPYALLRRIAVHLFANTDVIGPDEALTLAASDDLADDREVAQELHELLRFVGFSASKEAVERYASSKDPKALDEFGRNRWFQALSTLRLSGARADRLETALTDLNELSPELVVEEHPGFGFWMEVGWPQGTPPMPTDEFHTMVVADAPGAVAYIERFDSAVLPRDDTSRLEDAISMLADTVRHHPEDGLKVWPHVGREAWSAGHNHQGLGVRR